MTTRTFSRLASSIVLLGPIALACSGSSEPPLSGFGGAVSASGGTSSAAGGSVGTGGTIPANGGSGKGGASPTSGGSGQGGAATTGGASPTSGGSGQGGAATTGGSTSAGGKATGGAATGTGGKATGGAATGTGGKATGGAATNTGGKATGGAATGTGGQATGGLAAGGQATGGKATGGVSTGGAATGGAATGGAPASTCTTADLEVCASYKVGTHCGLTYEIWTDSSSSCMTNTSYGFKAVWDTGDLNYLARKGVRPGSTSPVVTYSANYQPNGNSYLAIYGWTTSPLIEYYIVDSWGTWRPPGTAVIGTVTVDGGTYDIYRSERVNQPSIQGNTTFWQYWSVRQAKRTSGTITVAPHFAAWAAFGLTLGTFYEVSLVVEGYHSAGTADVTVSFK